MEREYLATYWDHSRDWAKVTILAPNKKDARSLAQHLKDSLAQLAIIPQGGGS